MSQMNPMLDRAYELLKPLAAAGPAALEAAMRTFVERGWLTSDEAVTLFSRLIATVAPPAPPAPPAASTASVADAVSASQPNRPAGSARTNTAAPTIIIDWGTPPMIGHTARPTLTIDYPGACGKPLVQVQIDSQIDCDGPHGHDFFPELEARGAGRYEFALSVCLTTRGANCRPGQYFISVKLAWPDLPADQTRFFRGRIRLAVQDPQHGGGPVLRITSDDHALINLQGLPLDQFARIELQGNGASMLNMLSATSAPAEARSNHRPSADVQHVTRLSLWPDDEQQGRLPHVAWVPSTASHATHPTAPSSTHSSIGLTAACLNFSDGRRIGVLAQDHVTFGRNRRPEPGRLSDQEFNDVCLRFLPSSTVHDELSNRLSRRHFELTLRNQQLHWSDRSSGGIEWDGARVARAHVQSPPPFNSASYQEHQLDLRLHASPANEKLQLRVTLFGRPVNLTESRWGELWDSIYARQMQGALCELWRFGHDTGMDAIRLDRLNNAADESYLLVVRQAMFGGWPPAIPLDRRRSTPSAARLVQCQGRLWIETLHEQVRIDDQPLPAHALVPLCEGMVCQMHDYTIQVQSWR